MPPLLLALLVLVLAPPTRSSASERVFDTGVTTGTAPQSQRTSQRTLSYSNVQPRVDTAGRIIDGHDGNYVYDETRKRWFAYLMGYGLCSDTGTVNGCDSCGGSWNNTVGIWSNTQLGNTGWVKEGEVMPYALRPAAANGTWYRSHGVYNAKKNEWVVWINAQHAPDCLYGYACFLTATSSSPTGPFSYTGAAKTLTNSSWGDLDLFVDDDGVGYMLGTRIGGGVPAADSRRVIVERLSPDFLSGVAASETFGPGFIEAPSMFKRKGTYYAMTGGCTCFGLGGAGIVVNTASSPLGPWTTRSVSLDPGCPVGNRCGTHPGDQNRTGPSALSFCGGVGGDSPDREGKGERRVVLACDTPGATIANVSYASYGTFFCHWKDENCAYTSDSDIFPGTCDDLQPMANSTGAAPARVSSCSLVSAAATVKSRCLGKGECSLSQGPPTFPSSADPCPGIYKSLFVRASCSDGSLGHVTARAPVASAATAACVPVTQSQQNYIIRVGGSASGTGATAFIWTGDRWQTGGNNTGAAPPGLKGWDYQFWAPLEWDDSASPPVPKPLKWLDSWSVPITGAA